MYDLGRNGKGSIFTWAAGNGGWNYDSCATDGYSSSIYTISVGSADQTGGQASYDEDCAGKMVVTYSFNSQTFSREGDYYPYNQIVSICYTQYTGSLHCQPPHVLALFPIAAYVLLVTAKEAWFTRG